MATFPADSIRTKQWGTEVLTTADLHSQLDLLHTYLQAALNSSTGHAHTGASNQGPKLSDASLNPITTAGKVNASSITGIIPFANLSFSPVTALGTVSGTVVLVADNVNTATLSDNVTLTLPSPTSGELHSVVFEFTMAVARTVTVSGVTWNYSVTPSIVITKKNRMVFDTIDGGSTWKGYYSQF